MPKINPIILLFLIVLALTSMFLTLSLFGVRRVYDSGISQTDRLVPLLGGKPIIQKINPQQNGLNTVFVYMRNRSILNTSPISFVLSDNNGNVIHQININGSNVGDGENIRFQFPPVSDSAGQSYTVTLSTPKNAPNEPNIEIGYTKDIMSYLAYYRPTSKSLLLKNIMIASIPKLNQPRLYLVTLLFGGLNYYLLNGVIKKTYENK